MGQPPFLSVIIPTFDRRPFVLSALESCVTQSFGDWEAIVVDDASTDGTCEAVGDLGDQRIICVRLERNQGPGPARNAGVDRARGKWLLMLDSDFEVLPDTFERISRRAERAADDVGNLASSCVWDTGLVTPYPNVPDGPVGYQDFLRWFDSIEVSEWFNCFRREVFEDAHYPSTRAHEFSFHLAVALRWKIDIEPEPAVVIRTSAPNRLTASAPTLQSTYLLRDAEDQARDAHDVLARHGSALQRFAPLTYRERVSIAATNSFLAGRRRTGLAYSFRAIRGRPLQPRYWATLILGLISRRLLAAAKSRRGPRISVA